MSQPELPESSFEPRWPGLWAGLTFVLAALTLCYPMLSGQSLLGDDQLTVGYGFREWGAAMFREGGHIPQWFPYQFGGMPYVGAMHGDIFYPTAWLRWFLPVDTAMNLSYAAHLVLAGGFMYLFLRALRLGWTAVVAGGLAYELSGILASLVSPGHDGKLYVSALAPLAFFALLRAVRDQRLWGYGVFALVVGLGLLSPHYQMTYYLLVACGLWTLYLVFFDPERPAGIKWHRPIGLAFGAVVLGLGISAIQAVPFLEYIPYSPRGAGGPSAGWEYATSYSLPIEELFTTVLPQFNGVLDHYWGGNFFKLHSEYLGAAVIIPAVLAFGAGRRKLVIGLGVIAALFLLVAFGGHSPFYRLWYEVMPMMKKVRAPGMAFFLVALVIAVYAALGVERLVRRQVKWSTLAIVAGVLGVIALLGAAGGLQTVARTLAQQQQMGAVEANARFLQGGALRLLVVVLAAGIVMWLVLRGTLRGAGAAAAIAIVIVGDLWSIDRLFFRFHPPGQSMFASDALTDRIKAAKPPFRVLDAQGSYQPSFYIVNRIQNILGYHGNEERFYDDLLGGKNVWNNIGSPNIWNLMAVRFFIMGDTVRIPGFHLADGPVLNARGHPVFLYEQDTLPPYVRVVPAAAKVPEDQIIPTVVDPRFPIESVVLFSDTSHVAPQPIQGAFIPPVPVTAELAEWAPGRMRITLQGSAPSEAYLLVSETWYPDWQAAVDGKAAPVLRGDNALITVALPPGAREVVLGFQDPQYGKGRLITIASLLLTLALVVIPAVRHRRSAVV